MDKLVNISQVKDWNLFGEFRCKVQKCYDGDTCSVVIFYNNEYFSFNIRLFGIDTPELHGINHNKAIKSRNRLISLLVHQEIKLEYEYSKKELDDIFEKNKKIVVLKCKEIRDKYGRILGEIYPNDTKKSASDVLLEEGYAYAYDGKTKKLEI
jgi:micrococcal nuclease